MTVDDLERIRQQTELLGVADDARLLVMSTETASGIDGLQDFCDSHGLTLKINRKAAPGIIYWADLDRE